MFGGTAIDANGEAIAEAIAFRDQLDAQIALAVGQFDRDRAFEADGDLTTRTWLAHHTRRDPHTAANLVRCGRRLRAWPTTADAAVAGHLSGGQIALIVALVGRHIQRWAIHEALLVPLLAPLTIDQTRAVLQEWRTRADALDAGPEPRDRPDTVHLSGTLDGRGELHGSLGADLHALVATALQVADNGDLTVAPAERRADALETVCRFFLDNQADHPGRRHRAHLNVVFTYQDLLDELGGTYLDTGGPVTPSELGVLACDSVLHRMVVAKNRILDYGRATKVWPADLYNAIAARDQGCRWPRCDRPAAWCDIHHLHEWRHGGATSLDNGIMLCRRHHRHLHQRGTSRWRAKLLPDGTLETTSPTGATERSQPRGPMPRTLWARTGGG